MSLIICIGLTNFILTKKSRKLYKFCFLIYNNFIRLSILLHGEIYLLLPNYIILSFI